jgi:ankyrin repeat protein
MRRTAVGWAAVLVLGLGVVNDAAAASDVADAAMRGDVAVLRTLLQQKSDVNAPQVDGATALHWAVYRGDVAMVDLLLGAGANVASANREGVTPLAMASLYGHLPIVERLLQAGADVKERGPNGETVLMFAARNGDPQLIRALIAAGADVNATESLRVTTALMWAVEQRHPEAVKALLAAGADPNAKSGGAGLPRNYMANRVNTSNVKAAQERRRRAAAAGRTYEEELELERKLAPPPPPRPRTTAQAGVQPRQGVVAEAAAEAEENSEIAVAGLVGGGGGGLSPLVFAAREGDIESARALLDAGARVNQTTEYGWTPLLAAVNNRNYALSALLLDRGADPNLATKGGWTPLYLATDNRNIEGGDYPVPKPDMEHLDVIRRLLEKGADPNAQIRENTLTRTIFTMQWFLEDGATAFVRAAQSGDTELMRLLLEHGADPKIATAHGDTALTAAGGVGWVEGVTFERSHQDNLNAVRMLLDLGLDPNAANMDGRTALMGAALKGRNDVVRLLVERGASLEQRDYGSRDTDKTGSAAAGHTWQALDYADGLVRAGVQSAIAFPETAKLIRELMVERGLPVPPVDRNILSVCVVSLCQGD